MLLTEETYRAIRRDIITCALPAGSEVTEIELCGRYSVGKAPVRLALSRLGQEGLVRAVPRQGYEIAPVTVRDIEEIFEMRLIVEPAAARTAASRATSGEIEALADLGSVPDERGDLAWLRPILDRNREFHLGIAKLSGNARLVGSITRLSDEADRAINYWLTQTSEVSTHVISGKNNHSFIAAALLSRDPEAAALAMYRHIKEVRDDILAFIGSLPQDEVAG